jgi:starvation-inducible DNA-binding protein
MPAKRSTTAAATRSTTRPATAARRTTTASRRPAAATPRPAASDREAPGRVTSAGRAARARNSSQPWLHQKGLEIQEFGTVRQFPIGLSRDTRMYSCQRLTRTLADTQILYALYKKHHWLMRGATFYQLHLLLDKHAGEQLELVDLIAERIQTLGGVAVGDPRHVAELTVIPRPPDGVEEVPAMLSRLLEAHELILADAHDAAARAAEFSDDGTNDLLVSDVIRTGELQSWFLAEHLVDTPLVRG